MKKEQYVGSPGGNGRDSNPIGADIRIAWRFCAEHGNPESQNIAKYMLENYAQPDKQP